MAFQRGGKAIQVNNVIMLTKVALDSVFAHANENCETRMTLQDRQKECVVRKGHAREKMGGVGYIPGGR